MLEEATTSDRFHYTGSKELLAFNNWYRHYHGYVSAAVCLLGIATNFLNVAVLTRGNMVSATNCILTGLAVSDALTMAAYLPFAVRFYVLYGPELTPERNSLSAVRFLLFYACFSVVVHTASIWLTVTLAVFRCVFVRLPHRAPALCSVRKARAAVVAVYVASVVVCLPNIAAIGVHHQGAAETGNSTAAQLAAAVAARAVWTVRFRRTSSADRFVYSLNFWVQAVVVKLVPCVGLTVLSVLIVRAMRRTDARRRHLTLPAAAAAAAVVCFSPMTSRASRMSHRRRKTNRTTRMLLVVVALFVATEFPQGVANVLCGISRTFTDEIYLNIGDLLDVAALTNSAINFVLYCSMSKQFRDAFAQFFFFLASSKTTATALRTPPPPPPLGPTFV